MKILFKNITKYDQENCNNFKNFHKNKYGKKELLKSILMSICVLYIIVFNIIYASGYAIFVLVPIFILIYFINKKQSNKSKAKNKEQKNKEFTFFFYERCIKINYKRQFERLNYLKLKKIFETEQNFFLYTDDTHSLILDKEGFKIGNSKEFSEFIKRKCPLKYSKNNT